MSKYDGRTYSDATTEREAKAAREGADYWIAPAIMDQLAGELFKLSDEAGDLGEEIDKGCLEVGEQREATVD